MGEIQLKAEKNLIFQSAAAKRINATYSRHLTSGQISSLPTPLNNQLLFDICLHKMVWKNKEKKIRHSIKKKNHGNKFGLTSKHQSSIQLQINKILLHQPLRCFAYKNILKNIAHSKILKKSEKINTLYRYLPSLVIN